MAPAGTPKAVVDKLNREINAILKSQEIVKRYNDLGAETLVGSPEDFSKYLDAETRKWTRVAIRQGHGNARSKRNPCVFRRRQRASAACGHDFDTENEMVGALGLDRLSATELALARNGYSESS